MQHQVPEFVRERQPYPVGRRGVIEQDYRVIADPLRQTVHASGAEVFGNEHAACGLQPLRKVPD